MSQSKAIVLQKIKYSEASIIIKMFTEKEGLLSFVVKGVRGKKGKLRTAQFQPLNLLEITYQSSKKKNLKYITDLRITTPFSTLLFDPVKRSIVMFITELIQKTIKEEEANTELFQFLYTSISWLDLSNINISNFHLYFMMKLTKHLGFFPLLDHFELKGVFDLKQGAYSPDSRPKPKHSYFIQGKELFIWKKMASCNIEGLTQINLSKEEKRSLLNTLMIYYKLHLIHFKELNSHHILQTILHNE